jgi:hypothetical protein
MTATILKFTKRRTSVPSKKPLPRRRVFYAGYRYVGPNFCQDVQQVYLKRHGSGWWSLIFYYQGRVWEIDTFTSASVPFKLEEYEILEAPTLGDLERMGWEDRQSSDVIELEYYLEGAPSR